MVTNNYQDHFAPFPDLLGPPGGPKKLNKCRNRQVSQIVTPNVTPNETANVTPNETANVMHMNSSLVAKFGNRPARSHRNPKILILTKFDYCKCTTAREMAIFVFGLLN